MPSAETIERFIAGIESNDHVKAVEEFYTEDATMRENQKPPRGPRSALVENERRVIAKARSVESICVRPAFVAGDFVVLRWIFRFAWLDGSTTELEELSYQRWEGERVAEEQFFYDPAQFVRKPAA
jgi:hypothetical protein